MAGVARLAVAQGQQVRGCDDAIYPPMSTQLKNLGIEIDLGYSADHLTEDCQQVIIGNVLSRGNPLVEQCLERGVPYTSGPAWLAQHVLNQRKVVAVAGSHGKTTTASMLSWILEHTPNIAAPGFLIGGAPNNFDFSAQLGEGSLFVVEADEYDTAFFDKRPKFMHYHPTVLVLNNLEFDHADIYDDIEMIKQQFHYLIRTVPGHGIVLYNKDDDNLVDVVAKGAWTPRETFAVNNQQADWNASTTEPGFELFYRGQAQGCCEWSYTGIHNVANAVAATAAATQLGVSAQQAMDALASFSGVKRRGEKLACVNEITVYDDFAHHPTEIAATLTAAQAQATKGRVLAVFEPRSSTMRMGWHNDRLRDAFFAADRVFFYQPPRFDWSAASLFFPESAAEVNWCTVFYEHDGLLRELLTEARAGDHVIFMSSGDFSGLPHKFVTQLQCPSA